MPVRIYALAKELKIDSKDLVEICEKAGLPGKGSALASLTDDEVEKVKAIFTAKDAPPVEKEATVEVQTSPQPSRPSITEVVRREDYISPGGTAGKPKNLESRPEKTGEAKKKPVGAEPGKPAPKTAPQIKLAPMPATSRPVEPPPPVEEPAPQKPDLKLPMDAIRAGKMGSKPLSEHIRQHEEKRKAEAAKTVADRGRKSGTEPETDDEKPLSRRDKRRKGIRQPGTDGDTLGGREQRQLSRRRSSGPRRRGDEEEQSVTSSRNRSRPRRLGVNTAAPRKSKVTLPLPCTVAEFSEASGIPIVALLNRLLQLNVVAAKNAPLDAESAQLLAMEMGVEVEFREETALEDELIQSLDEIEDSSEDLRPRPPIVTFLGHVDHGKTSLLDKIIGTNVVSAESGGITQHIRAYQIEKNGQKVSFVDTPGHEAFTQMRARGANVTDIVVLVVAADDGLMPQTEEAISHAKAAGVPIVVALNKIDLPSANPQRAYEQLSARELLPSEWGGDTEVIKTSAITGEGLNELLETLLTIAELHDFKANPSRPGIGTCLEAELHEGRGTVCKLIVQIGTLKVGDVVVCGPAYGRVKALYDTLAPTRRLTEAGPSMPVNVTGLHSTPAAGDTFHVLSDVARARDIATARMESTRAVSRSGRQVHVTLENLSERLQVNEVQMLNLVLKADTRGSIEAIQKEFTKLENREIKLQILHQGVGGITEGDVTLADASDAIIIGFNVVPDEGARLTADRWGVQIKRYEIIYKLTEDLKLAMEGLLRPEEREMEIGRALVQRLFVIGRIGTVAGCRVISGLMKRNARVRVIRENRVIGDYPMDSLKREKDDAREVREGLECGIKLSGFNDIKEGDILEAYTVEEVARELETVQ